MADPVNIECYTFKHCQELIVSEIAQDVREMADVLFQHGLISEDTYDKVNELNDTKKNKARLLVRDIERQVKSYPTIYEQILTIFSEKYADLVTALQDEHKKITTTSQDSKLV